MFYYIKLVRDGLLLTQLLREYRVAFLGGSFSIGIRVLHRMLPCTTLVYPLLAVYAVNLITINEDTYATSPTFVLIRYARLTLYNCIINITYFSI